jgi:uncharacterized paraquat-inducible protein A
MSTLSLEQFLALVAQRRLAHTQQPAASRQTQREKVLRPDQIWRATAQTHERQLATCPQCDAVVDSEIIDPRSGLCPICHREQYPQR